MEFFSEESGRFFIKNHVVIDIDAADTDAGTLPNNLK